jgi:NAD+ synthase (glutamine-hydrolysing)
MVMPKVRLSLAQINPTVGDIASNAAEILATCRSAADAGADIVVFGEMSITGYPIEDLATRESFVVRSQEAVHELANKLVENGLGDLMVVVGHPALAESSKRNGWAIAQNCASVLLGGKILGKYAKHHLPNYSVFDEYRNFVPGNELLVVDHLGLKFAIVICEDIWQDGGPVSQISAQNADVTLVLNGSPFEVDKDDRRLELVRGLATKHKTTTAYVNLVGGQDDLVFDGDSIVVDANGNLIGRSYQFENDLLSVDIEGSSVELASVHPLVKNDDTWQIWNALVLGLRDYVTKNGFKTVVLGLSGGIDSAVCAAIASDAIGAENVYGISMPSVYSSDHSKSDAQDLAERIGCHYYTVPIEPMVQAFENELQFSGLASENLQARVRGVILMGLSNQFGHLTLTTGNKTELAVGYSTIYGDSVGGFAPIKDVEKTLVWELARWRNLQATKEGLTAPIPENSISKPPSAELRPGQVDQDSLPEYDTLDAILELYVGQRASVDEIVKAGFDAPTVDRIVTLVDRAEWKRRQGAIGPKITGMAFGRDRRLPITNKNKEQ